MKILINQLSEMIEETGMCTKDTEFERGFREGLRVSVHMVELYNKLINQQGENDE